MEKQQIQSTVAETQSLFRQDNIDNPPKNKQFGESEQAKYSGQTTPCQTGREPVCINPTRVIKEYQPVTTSYVDHGRVEQPRPSQDHVSNCAVVVMSTTAVRTVPCDPCRNEPEALKLHQQQNFVNHEQPPPYTPTPDYSHITTWNHYHSMPPPRYQAVPTSHSIEGNVDEVGLSNGVAAVTTPDDVPHVSDNMGLSVFSFVCCCWFIGILAIMKSFETRSRNKVGDYEGAVKSSRDAKGLSLMGIIIGICIIFFVVLEKCTA